MFERITATNQQQQQWKGKNGKKSMKTDMKDEKTHTGSLKPKWKKFVS